jgi:hypothetical protein
MKRSDLIEAIKAMSEAVDDVLANWASGDLASAVNNLEETRDAWATPAIEWWNSDE